VSGLKLRFNSCFRPEILRQLEPTLPATYAAMNALAPWREGRWPTRVHCMDEAKIIDGRRRGAGHGYTNVSRRGENVIVNDRTGIWMNHHMSLAGHWLVLVHENLHQAFPDATEEELNNVLVPWVYQNTFGKKMNRAWARQHGLGPPQPGIGDRGFVR
jgi:hypothetical protein